MLCEFTPFLGNLRHFSWEFTPFWGKFKPIYTTWGPRAEKPVNPCKLPAWSLSEEDPLGFWTPVTASYVAAVEEAQMEAQDTNDAHKPSLTCLVAPAGEPLAESLRLPQRVQLPLS